MKKITCLDENYIYPKCHACKKELSPFLITSKELNKNSDNDLWITMGYLRINYFGEDQHLIWICKKCCKHLITKESK